MIEKNLFGRGAFLAGLGGIGGAALFVPASSGAALMTGRAGAIRTTGITLPEGPKIASLMRALGYNAIVDRSNAVGQRVIYRANGFHEITNAARVNPAIQFGGGGGNGFTTQEVGFMSGPSDATGGNLYQSVNDNTGAIVNFGYSNQIYAPVFSFKPTVMGPEYWVGRQIKRCAGEIASAAQQAIVVAQYIIKNAGLYTGILVTSASTALARWSGTQLGISAAAEFLGAVVAGLTVSQWLAIGVGVGITAAVAYAVYACLSNSSTS